jgi:hypothetical protein
MFRRFFTVDEKAWDSLSSIDRHTFQIGLLTRSWATIEGTLDICCDIAFRRLDGDKKVAELPRSLGKRFSMLRQVLADATDDSRLAKNGVDLIDCAREAADFRHLCIHGIAREEGGSFLVEMFKRFAQEYQPTTTRITHKEIAEAQMESTMLAYGFLNLLILILNRSGLADIVARGESQPLPLFGLNLHPYPTKRGKRIVEALQALSER